MKKQNFFSEIRSPGVFGKRPLIGVIIFAIGILVFVLLALNYKFNGPLIGVDIALAKSLQTIALKTPSFIIRIFIDTYYVGKQGIAFGAYILAVYFLFKKFWRELVMVLVTFAPLGNLFLIISRLFNRPRPFVMFDKPIWANSPNIPGFPSGHSLSMLVLCGFVVYFLYPKFNSYLGKRLTIAIGLFVVLFMGFSRLFIGDHFLTDIIAGYGVGIAWLALTITLVEFGFEKFKK
jgi:undecaprenyl-diphosphatase